MAVVHEEVVEDEEVLPACLLGLRLLRLNRCCGSGGGGSSVLLLLSLRQQLRIL